LSHAYCNHSSIVGQWLEMFNIGLEAKYHAISKVFKEVKFVYYLLCDLYIKMNLPILVRTDNNRAMFMLENTSIGFCTCYVDTIYHFVREFIEGGFIKIYFVCSAENDSDLFTKKSSQELYERQAKNFLENCGYYSTG
jgi:hypothetical protein